MDAAGRGDLDRVKDILAREPALATGDYTTAEGFSAVSLALHNRREVVVGYLLGRRAPLVLPPAGTYRRLIATEVAASMADPKVLEDLPGPGPRILLPEPGGDDPGPFRREGWGRRSAAER